MGYLDNTGLSKVFTKLKALIDKKVDATTDGTNAALNRLTTGSSVPTDNDYFISQYVGGGTTTTTYHRRPVSALWSYIKGKTDSLYQKKGSYAGSSSDGGAANSAVKLATARTIGAGTAVTSTAQSFNGESNITIPINSVKESYLDWGGRGVSGSVSPVGMALSAEHSANRLAFINGNALTMEYSSDGGSTWKDYGYEASYKSAFCTTSMTVPIGRTNTTSNYTTNSRTRITIDGALYVYTNPRKLLVNISSSGQMKVLVEYKTGASGATWQTFGTYNLVGWSGWNDIPLVLDTFGCFSGVTTTNRYLRMTFIMASVDSNYPTTAQVSGIRLFGSNDWIGASGANSKGPMSSTGHLYSYDINANATFPAQVTATSFNGTATRATKLAATAKGSATQPVYINSDGVPTATTYTLGKSVPSDAVFTDTNTWRGIQNNLTSTSTTDSLSAAQGKKLNDGKLGAVSANGYYGMANPDGTTTGWIRTTSSGIIPYTSNGSSALGTSSWPFNNAYITTVNGALNGSVKPVTTAGSGSAYTATVNGVTLTAGVSFVMVPHVVSASTAPTLNVNSLGAKSIRLRVSNSPATTTALPSSNFLTAKQPVRVMYDGTYWVVEDMVRPNSNALYGTVPVASGGTGATAAGTTLLKNIGITSGTEAPASTGTAGTIYIQYT